MIFSPFIVIAQTPPMSTPSPTPAGSSTGNDTEPTLEITSPQDGQRLPVGEWTIQGTSSDNIESNCQVYADVNDITPMQNATGSTLEKQLITLTGLLHTHQIIKQLQKEQMN